jgi:hypothetical protein
LRQLGHPKSGCERQRRAVLICGIALIPTLISSGRIGDYQCTGVAFHSYAVVLRARVVNTLVFGPCVFGRWITFGYAWNFDIYSWIKYDFFVCLAYDRWW